MPTESPLKALGAELPALILRERWNDLNATVGLPYRASYMANLASRGEGPTPYKTGRKVYYHRAEVLAWLAERGTSSNGGGVR